eukprot:TRINITY_DN3232_c0_g1_i1.p1 TRINITY_DN3232_c0_g1~~TRINITY_DN3232_c0_g1_i1.p1  ORF type:complete len:471 (+),score=144.01 TRINITY_DN3232_c0_g1_i1:98-1510(+)
MRRVSRVVLSGGRKRISPVYNRNSQNNNKILLNYYNNNYNYNSIQHYHSSTITPQSRLEQDLQTITPNNTESNHNDNPNDKPTPQPLSILLEDEEVLRQSAAQFAQDQILPRVQAMDHSSILDPQLIESCFEQGYMGIEIPSSHSGSGLSFFDSIIVIEEFAKVDPGVAVFVDVQNTLVNNLLIRFGNPQQQALYYPKLSTSTVGSFCLSEWSCGSDAFALQTTATPLPNDPDTYVLNGTKAWITNAYEAGLFIVMATIDKGLKHKGITSFLVPRDTPGLSIGKKEDKTGIRASSTCEVILNNVKVHKSQILGEKGKGYKIAIETLNEGRIGIAAQMLGLAEGCFDKTMKYLNQRVAFGKKIAAFQGVQFQIARMASDIEGAKLMVYNAARLKARGEPFVKEAAMAKLVASETAERVSSECCNLMGGLGFVREGGVEKYWRDCKIGQIYEGTSNIQLQTIAKLIEEQYSK